MHKLIVWQIKLKSGEWVDKQESEQILGPYVNLTVWLRHTMM